MKHLLAAGTPLKLANLTVILGADVEFDIPVVDKIQLAETLAGVSPTALELNLPLLEHERTFVREVKNEYDISGDVKREKVTESVSFGPNGVTETEEINAEPFVDEPVEETVVMHDLKPAEPVTEPLPIETGAGTEETGVTEVV